ncbi:MAG: [FeFe] hydrogenase H-cluster radical SAM maturase HydE [Ignavibacteriales bacterium]
MEHEKIIDFYRKNQYFTRDQLVKLLSDNTPEVLENLRTEADQVRHENVGDAVHVRGIIEFSNNCIRRCSYCGINRNNDQVTRYRINTDIMVNTAKHAAQMGYKTLVLQSGDDFFYTGGMLAEVISEIKNTGMAVTLAVGERPVEDYRLWREAGADRYLLKFETSDQELYAKLHPGTSLRIRLGCLKQLRDLGYQLGSGFMVGLPGQTIETLADDLLLMSALELEMAGMGPFIPHPETPLGHDESGSVTLTLKVLALARLLMPWIHLPATTALSSLEKDGRRLGLTGGANVLMPNLTPIEYRRLYEIYPHKAEILDTPEKLYHDTLSLINDLGRETAEDHGHGLMDKTQYSLINR